jgi:GNAT superfamily N-acetyltransferase
MPDFRDAVHGFTIYRMTMTIAALAVSRVHRVDELLREELLACWLAVSNAGGAVGFVPPVDAGEITPVLDALLDRVDSGAEALVVLRENARLVGFAALALADTPLRRHWATVRRVQVLPEMQGRGFGTALMRGVHDEAQRMGMEMLHLTVRGGTGRERFYEQLGYAEFGRLPGGFRVGPGDDRDEIHLYVRL